MGLVYFLAGFIGVWFGLAMTLAALPVSLMGSLCGIGVFAAGAYLINHSLGME